MMTDSSSAIVTSTAVGSVDLLADLIVSDTNAATSIKTAVTGLEGEDLNGVRDGTIPEHVALPDGETRQYAVQLARAYATAELADRERRSAWWKSSIGWSVTIATTILGALLAALATWAYIAASQAAS